MDKIVMRLLATASLLGLWLSAGPARALTGGASDEAERLSGLGLTTAAQTEAFISTLQWPVPRSPKGFSLTGQGLLGRYGLTARDVVQELAPHLADLKLVLARSSGSGDAVHETYAFQFGEHRLQKATLTLHHYRNKLAMVRASLPTYRLPATPFTDADFLPVDALGYATDGDERQTAKKVLAESGGFPAPAWEITRFNPRTGMTHHLTVDAQTGALLSSRVTAFDLAQVYEEGPNDPELATVELPDLPGTGYLDGKRFTVYAPTASDPRVMAPDNRFEFRPDDPADALSFDQVQAYYAATRAMAWFQQRFGDPGGDQTITVRINDLVGGRPDNALYVPPPEGPEIQIGQGNEVMVNLARDTDVILHEYGHHIIYPFLQEHDGESGVLHEGTADYFAYAMNGDPYLGETLIPGGAYLRTAALEEDDRYDELGDKYGAHHRGQYWSAVLWRLRTELGDQADRLVYDSLAYLGDDSGLRDAFLALLNADRDLNPLDPGSADEGVFGKNKCLILNAGVTRGFVQYLDDYDGLNCGFDLQRMAQESRGERGKGKAMTFGAFGKKCAVIDGKNGNANAASPLRFAWFWLPLLFVMWRSRQGRKHGS